MVLEWSCSGPGMLRECSWNGPGMVLECTVLYCSVLFWSWNGPGMVLFWSWNGPGMLLEWSWNGHGMVLECIVLYSSDQDLSEKMKVRIFALSFFPN